METFELSPEKIDAKTFANFTCGVKPIPKSSVSKKKPVQIRNGDELIVLKPKSMSLFHQCALVWDSKIADQLEEIDYEAFKSLLSFIENEHASARMYKNKERDFHNTKKLLFANFCHLLTANEQEPHWHWHCVIIPLTENVNKQLYVLQNGLIIRSAMLYGHLYRAQLLKSLRKSGVQIRITDYENCFFEIADIPEVTIKLLSSRSVEINEHKIEYSARYTMASDQKNSYLAKFKDRQNMSERNIEEIIITNVNKIEKSGFTRVMFSKILLLDKDVEALDLPYIIHKIYQKNGEQMFSFSHEWLFLEITKISIQLATGANISEITEQFKGGNYEEVTKKFIEVQEQKIIKESSMHTENEITNSEQLLKTQEAIEINLGLWPVPKP
jgi:conjugative relaxase-like TrwC/TraI family protein